MNLASIIEDNPADAVALVDGHSSLTYGELREQVASARAALVAAGVGDGDRVAVLAPNRVETVVALLAVLGVGAAAVPLNPQSPPAELARELSMTDVAGVVGASDDATAGGARRIELGRSAAPPVEAAPVVEREGHHPAVLVFTSGTAGAPRAAVLTHGNLLANLDQVARVADLDRRPDDVTLGLLPLFHVFGLNVVLLPALRAGGRVVLVDDVDLARVVALVVEHGVTLLTGPPTVWSALASLPDDAVPRGLAAADALATVRLAASGAAALPASVAARVRERFGLVVHEGYGLTETSPVVATSAGTDAPVGSIGRPLPGVEVRLLDEHGDDVLVGDVGHLHVRGPNVFAGYWGDDEATASVLTADGWLRTGDLAVVDDDGHLFLVDRAKDLIIVSGFNVFPAEVEEVLLEHPTVADAAVRGRPSERTGEAVVADVVPRGDPPADVDAWFDELVDHVAARLSRYKCPTELRVVDAIPRGLGGKVQRRLLTGGGEPPGTL